MDSARASEVRERESRERLHRDMFSSMVAYGGGTGATAKRKSGPLMERQRWERGGVSRGARDE
jgi:hypothetical protein